MKPILRWLENKLQALNVEELKKEIDHFCSELDAIDGTAVKAKYSK